MKKIQLLDEHTINQIAAGEVIENAGSVIKELIENALDAGATKIFVEIQNGGRDLIIIKDNGKGMTESDVKVAILRHATSKISAVDDLFTLQTMGFRGEALASIAAISELSISTAVNKGQDKDSIEDGTFFSVAAGKVLSCKRASCFAGTTIEVRSLFYNVPARKKFQKTPSRDAQDIAKLIATFALAYPEVEFEHISNFEKVLHFKAASFDNMKERLAHALGKDFVQDMRKVSFEYSGIKVDGYVGAPSSSKPNRSHQFLFVNRRAVISLPLSYAVKEGYGTAIEGARHPPFVLDLSLNPQTVDVNVHPQKKEVRFRNEDEIKKILIDATSQALFQNKNPIDLLCKNGTCSTPYTTTKPQTHSNNFSMNFTPNFQEKPEFLDDQNLPTQIFRKDASTPNFLEISHSFHVVGVFSEYIMLEINWSEKQLQIVPDSLVKQGLYIVDCKAALSRIAFEELSMAKEEGQKSAPSQQLLAPFFIELTQLEAAYFVKIIPYLKNGGFEIREFGKTAFLIEALPTTVELQHVEEFIREIVKEEVVDHNFDPVKAMRKIAESASRTSSRRKYPVDASLAKEIVKRLLSCKDPFRCPFGSATFAVLHKEDFKRLLS
jgi:DNA mismatch repair protein MutL